MKQWYIRKMVEAYRAGEFDEAMNYAKMAGVDIGDIAKVAESEREVLE